MLRIKTRMLVANILAMNCPHCNLVFPKLMVDALIINDMWFAGPVQSSNPCCKICEKLLRVQRVLGWLDNTDQSRRN